VEGGPFLDHLQACERERTSAAAENREPDYSAENLQDLMQQFPVIASTPEVYEAPIIAADACDHGIEAVTVRAAQLGYDLSATVPAPEPAEEPAEEPDESFSTVKRG